MMPFDGLSPAPELVRAPFGLETVATVIEHTKTDGHWALGYQQESALCQHKGTTWEPCNSASVADLFVPGDGDRWTKVVPFFVQAEDLCKDTLAAKRPEARTNLMELLNILSFKGLEHELWYGTHAEAATIPDTTNPYLEQAGSVSVGTVMDPVVALAAVVERLAVLLPGAEGVVHMTPGMAVILSVAGALEADGKVMRVKGSGTPVTVGSGYADTTDTGGTIYGTGPVVAHMGPSVMVTDNLAEAMKVSDNEITLLAERPIGVTFDPCVHVKAGVSY